MGLLDDAKEPVKLDNDVCSKLDVDVCSKLDVDVCSKLDDDVCSRLDVLLIMFVEGFSVGPFRLVVPLSAPPQPLNAKANIITMSDEQFISCKFV